MSNVKSQIYAYYPGCSAHATAQEYDASVKAVFEALGLKLVELEDWNCCGASSAHNLSANLAVGLPARNLALIEKSGLPALTPCAACYNRLRVAQKEIEEHPEKFGWLVQALGAPLEGSAVVRSPLGILFQDVGFERIGKLVKKPLVRLRAVSYYGCLLARPAAVSELSDTEHPREIDELMGLMGAEMLPWSYGVDCCGGSLSISRADIARRMTQTIVDAAFAAGADVIITACPLCQTNMEMRQTARDGRGNMRRKMPVLYFTEAMGVAFDLPDTDRWWGKHLVDPRVVIRRDA